MSAAEDDEGWDPSKSDEGGAIRLSRSSNTITEGAWSKASEMYLESAWRMVGGFSKVSLEHETKILQKGIIF